MDVRFILVLFLTLLTVSWSGKTDEITSAPAPVSVNNLAQAVNDFGYKLMIKMMKRNMNNNIVISPTGIAGLLAMTLLGSVGKTYDELADALGFSQDILTNRKNHEQLGELFQALGVNNTQTRTLYADAIFVDANTQIREAYRNYLQNIYHGDALPAHFAQDVKTKELVNDWVKNNTGGKLEDFLENPLPINTKVVLLSALYFSGQWAQPFVPEYTAKMSFMKPTGTVMANLMFNAGLFNYKFSHLDGFHIVALPYNDNVTTMYVLKPRFPKRVSLTDLLDSLEYAKINEIINKMKKEDCVVRFPKLDLKSKVNLEQSLKDLGVITVFNPAEANFALMVDGNTIPNKTEEELISRINQGETEASGLQELVNRLPNPGVYVDSVLHDVKITVNEFGTEAVAATSGTLARSAVQFYADSPFYMFIRNEITQLVTFSAVIYDPTV